MRKAFNFYRSYYDVANELNDKERLKFYDALLAKQFDNIDMELEGIAKFAYLSQKHSIDSQVNGYFTKTKDEKFNPSLPPTDVGTQGGSVAPSIQEKEKEKEKVQYIVDVDAFLSWFNSMKKKYTGIEGKFTALNKTSLNNLKQLKQMKLTPSDWEHAFEMMCDNEWVKQNQMQIPKHFLVNDNFTRYLNQQKQTSNQPKPDKLVEYVMKQASLYDSKQ